MGHFHFRLDIILVKKDFQNTPQTHISQACKKTLHMHFMHALFHNFLTLCTLCLSTCILYFDSVPWVGKSHKALRGGGHSNNSVVHMRDQRKCEKGLFF